VSGGSPFGPAILSFVRQSLFFLSFPSGEVKPSHAPHIHQSLPFLPISFLNGVLPVDILDHPALNGLSIKSVPVNQIRSSESETFRFVS